MDFPNKYEALALLKLNSEDLSQLSPKELLNRFNSLVNELKDADKPNVAKILDAPVGLL